MNILVTGGAGYIGSHTIVELYKAGHTAVIVDNLSNSSREAVARISELTGRDIPFFEVDCTNKTTLDAVFAQQHIDAVIHFAGFKSVGESIAKPLAYYRNNIDSTLVLCELMRKYGVKNLVFSSSANVYGTSKDLPLTEESQAGIGLTNPYGKTKFMLEQILQDLALAQPDWHITILRYFNPVGAHESGRIGEDPADIPNNLLPYISQVAVGKLPELSVFGSDFDTLDGTGVRDYIHVVDLASGHVAALKHIADGVTDKAKLYNLGTGHGTSVLEAIKAFEQASSKPIPYAIKPRRAGDAAASYADSSKAERELDWKATHSFRQACDDAWRWQSQNPNGYKA